MDLKQIEALEALERKATQGTWERDVTHIASSRAVPGSDRLTYSYVIADEDADCDDLDMIVAARNSLHALLRLARIGLQHEIDSACKTMPQERGA